MKYTKMTPAHQTLKRLITEILAADGHYATYKAVSDFLRVHWRGLMNSRRDPRDALNARIVLKSSLHPGAVTWTPGVAFNKHIAARLRAVLGQHASAGTLASGCKHPGAPAAGGTPGTTPEQAS